MAIGPDAKAGFVALNRFAFGARGGAYAGDLARAAADPRGLLKAELMQPGIAHLSAPTLPTTKAALQAAFAEQERIRIARENSTAQSPSPQMAGSANAGPPAASDGMGTPPTPAPSDAAPGPAGPPTEMGARPKQPEPPVGQRQLRADALARFQRAARAEVGFAERLVHFWSNHFCISAAKGPLVRVAAGCFEREAIRPHVLGRFGAMLQAVESHPAMLAYLDNALSFGPNSPAGRNRNRGLNENLAREILELHTLGVDGGYTQADVTALARIITGWTFSGREGRLGEPGTFVFFPNGHEPGDHTLLGKAYAAGGVKQGEAALADLARRPATARHIAGKLARHFVADEPPPSLVDRLAKVFRETDGDLKAVAIALVDSDEAWTTPLAKMRTPGAVSAGGHAGHRSHAGGPGRAPRPPQRHGHAAMAATGAQRLARHGVGLGLAQGHQIAPRRVGGDRCKGEGPRQPRPSCSRRSRGCPHRARRARRSRAPIAPAGVGAVADVPRVSMEIDP